MIEYLILIASGLIIYKIFSLPKCPKSLEHLPAMPYFANLKFVLSQRGFNDKMKDLFQRKLDEHGVIRVYGMGGWGLFVGDGQLSKEIAMKSDIFDKPKFDKMPINPNIWKFFGKSQVAINNGEEWKRHRKIVNPIFNRSWKPELFGDCVSNLVDAWELEDGNLVKVHDLIQRMTLDVLGKAIFDINFNAVKDKDSKLFNLYNSIVHTLFEQIPYLVFHSLETMPYFKRDKLVKDLDDYNAFVEEIIKAKYNEIDEGTHSREDLIKALILANNETDETKLSLEEIRDNIKIFILAGHDTTSNTLTSTLYYLARYPEIQQKLYQETMIALENPKSLTIPTVAQLKSIPYLDMINKESMRIMTTATSIQREAMEDHVLSNGLMVPKGTQVHLQLWAVHHNPKIYSNPDVFDPERFREVGDQSRNWQAFTTGPRSCIGSTFSLMEQRVAICMLIQKFEFSIESNNPDYHHLRLSPLGIIRPKDLKLNIKLRT